VPHPRQPTRDGCQVATLDGCQVAATVLLTISATNEGMVAMLGLRARVSGRPPVTMALGQQRYLITSGWSWTRSRRSKLAKGLFHGTGIDDREDHLQWFAHRDPQRGSSIAIEVVDVAVADWPRRSPRRNTDWQEYFREHRVKDRHSIEQLAARLREVRQMSPRPADSDSVQRPSVGVSVSLDGHPLGKIGVGDPGSLSVTVYLRHRPDGDMVHLHVHGGENVGRDRWRWRKWRWEERKLAHGARVRIDIVGPTDVDPGEIREIVSYKPTTAEELREALRELRKKVKLDRYRKEAIEMMARDRARPTPRHYPRATIRV
jgi:hypothetical protein